MERLIPREPLENSTLQNVIGTIFPSVARVRARYDELVGDLNSLIQNETSHRNEIAAIQAEKDTLSSDLKYAKNENQDLSLQYQLLEKKELEVNENLRTAQIAGQTLKEELYKVQVNLSDLQSRYDLVCAAVSPVVQTSERYARFSDIQNNLLLPFMNKENVVSNEAEQVLKLKAIEDELRLTESLTHFSGRSIVAVAGGFSSGKSSFITSLFTEGDVRLPIGIEPVTAIPTYVFNAPQNKVVGYTPAGGAFDISLDVYNRLSHAYVEDFGFNLRDLLPFIALETPMESYDHLSFIDLPGYNPGDRDGTTSGDSQASSEFMNQAHCVIWVIGLDANGTISSADIDHLTEYVADDIPLYVVLNKADLRPAETLEDILAEVEDELVLAGINAIGVSAYSSEAGGELMFSQCSLDSVLDEWNQPRNSLDLLRAKLQDILDEYQSALEQDIKDRKGKTSLLKKMQLNLLQLGAFSQQEEKAFDLEKYLPKNDLKDENQKRVTRSFPFFSTHIAEEEPICDEGATIPENDQHREELINNVKDQLASLREAHRPDGSVALLAELQRIRAQLEAVFS